MSKHPAPATLRDVATHCGVSLATASKALSPFTDRCDIGGETRERIRAAAARLGFSRNRSASVRARRRWNNIGLAWGRHAPRGDGIYAELFETAARALKRWGYHLLFTPVEDAADWLAMQQVQRLDGILAVESLPQEVLERIAADGYPAVLFNLPSALPLPQILPDDRAGAAALAVHLAGLGHRRAVYVPRKAWATHPSDELRWDGIRSCAELDVANLAPAAAVARCISGAATAIVTYSQSELVTVLEPLRASGLEVPRQVSLAVCCDVPWLAHLHPAVTAMTIPVPAMAETAVSLLVDLIERSAEPRPTTVLVPETLVPRASTGRAPRT